jgi:N-acetylmuramoyl-L-alanine amidase
VTTVRVTLVAAGMTVLVACTTSGDPHIHAHAARHYAAVASRASAQSAAPPPPSVGRRTRSGRLHGKVIVIDPGHQLGNATHPHRISRLVNAGGFLKACNTTGTATNSGYPEATFAWRVAQALKRQLRSRGATVYLTRHTNSYAHWGPCIDARGRKGNQVHADAAVSLHGDGAGPGVRGFFVIRPSDRRGWTSDIYSVSHRLARHVRSGLVRAGVRVSNGYGGYGFDVRGDLGTLNWSNVPIVMVELANMRNATDARHITSPRYRRHRFARGLRMGITSFVLHR